MPQYACSEAPCIGRKADLTLHPPPLCSNRAAAYLALGMWDEALKDSERARMLALDALKKTHRAGPLYIKTFAQKGEALIGELWIRSIPSSTDTHPLFPYMSPHRQFSMTGAAYRGDTQLPIRLQCR